MAAAPETAAKRFQIMKEIKPQAERVAVLWNAENSTPRVEWNAAKEFIIAHKIVVFLYDARNSIEG